jgi:2-phospho-L-lactate guanylyltransferase
VLAIVPVKASMRAKARLAHVLPATLRVELAHAMAAHVTAVLARSGLDPVLVSEEHLQAPPGVQVWPVEARGLNDALDIALRRVTPPVLVVPADLPWLDPRDVDMLLGMHGDVVVVRARDGGTNGLLLRRRIRPAFGPSSAARHAALSRAEGLHARVVDIAGFADDVDDLAGLVRALTSPAFSPDLRRRLHGHANAGERGPRRRATIVGL